MSFNKTAALRYLTCKLNHISSMHKNWSLTDFLSYWIEIHKTFELLFEKNWHSTHKCRKSSLQLTAENLIATFCCQWFFWCCSNVSNSCSRDAVKLKLRMAYENSIKLISAAFLDLLEQKTYVILSLKITRQPFVSWSAKMILMGSAMTPTHTWNIMFVWLLSRFVLKACLQVEQKASGTRITVMWLSDVPFRGTRWYASTFSCPKSPEPQNSFLDRSFCQNEIKNNFRSEWNEEKMDSGQQSRARC